MTMQNKASQQPYLTLDKMNQTLLFCYNTALQISLEKEEYIACQGLQDAIDEINIYAALEGNY